MCLCSCKIFHFCIVHEFNMLIRFPPMCTHIRTSPPLPCCSAQQFPTVDVALKWCIWYSNLQVKVSVPQGKKNCNFIRVFKIFYTYIFCTFLQTIITLDKKLYLVNSLTLICNLSTMKKFKIIQKVDQLYYYAQNHGADVSAGHCSQTNLHLFSI